jgi:hypothetical protein
MADDELDDDGFDRALIGAWFALVADSGRRFPTVAAAAHEAELSLARARWRFPARASVLMRFGRLADQAALTGVMTDAAVRDRLFDVVMRRIDQLQAHRAGVIATLRMLPANPPLALLLAAATERSMRWMLDACGVRTGGLTGGWRAHGMVAVWLYTVRAWERDESADLSATMAALDRALKQAERASAWLARPGRFRGGPDGSEPPAAPDEPPPGPPPAGPSPPDAPELAQPVPGEPEAPALGQPGLESSS